MRVKFTIIKRETVCATVPVKDNDPKNIKSAIEALKEKANDIMWERIAPDQIMEIESDSFEPIEMLDADDNKVEFKKEN